MLLAKRVSLAEDLSMHAVHQHGSRTLGKQVGMVVTAEKPYRWMGIIILS